MLEVYPGATTITAPGLNAVVETDLPGGHDVIVLANLDPPAAERMGRAVRERLR